MEMPDVGLSQSASSTLNSYEVYALHRGKDLAESPLRVVAPTGRSGDNIPFDVGFV